MSEKTETQETMAIRQLCREMKEALMQTMPYVEGAYECAFPDESENEYVMYKAKSAIAKFNELFKD